MLAGLYPYRFPRSNVNFHAVLIHLAGFKVHDRYAVERGPQVRLESPDVCNYAGNVHRGGSCVDPAGDFPDPFIARGRYQDGGLIISTLAYQHRKPAVFKWAPKRQRGRVEEITGLDACLEIECKGWRRHEGVARLTPVKFADQGARQSANEAYLRTPLGALRSGMQRCGIYNSF
jgi:hypothetical protein